jgi:hypothetical protein
MNVDLAANPDGRRLALSWLDLDTEDADLWVVNVDGSDELELPAHVREIGSVYRTHMGAGRAGWPST